MTLHQCYVCLLRGPSYLGRSRDYPRRGNVIRSDDPNFKYDINKRPKKERIQASKDSYLRATPERKKRLEDEYR